MQSCLAIGATLLVLLLNVNGQGISIICIAKEGERGGGESKPLKGCHNTCISHTCIIICTHQHKLCLGMQYVYNLCICNFREITSCKLVSIQYYMESISAVSEMRSIAK